MGSYVMAYFRTESEALHLADSDDGLRWTARNGNLPLLESPFPGTGLRDPHLSRGRDGRFHLLATIGWREVAIFHATSDDLEHWRDPRALPVMAGVPGARNAWAPEAFWEAEAGAYRLIWSTATGPSAGPDDWDHRIWGLLTPDFQEFSPAEPFYDPGHSAIDACVVPRPEGGYLMAVKDERGDNMTDVARKRVSVLAAPRAEGPWSFTAPDLSPPLTEGPALFPTDEGWTLLWDHFLGSRFGGARSSDGVRWTDVSDAVEVPPGARHASVLTL